MTALPGPCHARPVTLVTGVVVCAVAVAALTGDARAARRVRASDPEAVALLRNAAGAARHVPYRGRRAVTTWGSTVPRTTESVVAHTPGTAAGPPDTLGLLTRNYTLVRAADSAVCGRTAHVVEARRANGSTAGRFWLDVETGLMLYRELIDARGRPVVTSGFTEVRIDRPGPGKAAYTTEAEAEPAPAPAVAAWADVLDPGELAGLRARGWPLPAALPGRLSLYDARRSGPVVHLSYSDGLAAVSVFVQRGALDPRGVRGWDRAAGPGGPVYSREAARHWAVASGDGFVYTVLTEEPESTAEAVAVALPHERSPLRSRMGRGMRRLGSWINPFD
ncbi:sigma-E factor regulatory protein RseB domain-containing protein [Actinomadura parmotrematis]|uniref:MucB/RseB N-terminal domain-containing protein n=1 Tax=Actinomadura parmotrematis TaxID=2864039 RepID=A0ABS7FLX0_9ACTN|nr:sigma-E factor regulatory protein RseB domain-containing protein [Actinomadura parmotrematis]MBW8481354.1 hypothetical protein [Actinomadura parmotrematis]